MNWTSRRCSRQSRLLPRARRNAVYALYAFARTVDDIVDLPGAQPGAELDRVDKQLRLLLESDWFRPSDPVQLALQATVERYHIAPEYFRAFMDAMRSDLADTSSYATMAQLRAYMYGSAAVIGLQLLPVLGTVGPVDDAAPAAAALGEAFQLTNFIRDVGEDLDRGRVYLPTDEWAAFGVDAAHLRTCRARGYGDAHTRRALQHFVALNRDVYRQAEPGIAQLAPRVRPGIRLAFELYAAILDEVERNDFEVFDRRAMVPRRQKAIAWARRSTSRAR